MLFAGVMVTKDGPKLVEYNARFGDPETQVLMMRMMSDLLPALIASADGQLKNFSLRWFDDVALTVIMATKGYPGSYGKGSVISGLDDAAKVEGVEIFHAGTIAKDGKILASGGRVLNVCAMGKTVTRSAAARLCGRRPHQLAGRLLPPRHRLAGGGAGALTPAAIRAGLPRVLRPSGHAPAAMSTIAAKRETEERPDADHRFPGPRL